MTAHVGILGAGLAGLSAAWDLARQGYRVTVLDGGDAPGGLASSLDIEGQRVERFYHFLCRGDDDLVELAHELGVGDAIDWRPSTTSFFYEGRLYGFATPFDLLRFSPVPLSQRIRFGLTVTASRFRKDWDALDGVSARQWLIDHMGPDAYRVIWDPLLRVKFGPYHNQISAAWMWHRINRVARSRKSLLQREVFGCFREGSDALVQVLWQRLAAMPNVDLRLRSHVERVEVREGRVTAVSVADGGTIEVDALISTVALAALSRLVTELPRAWREQIEDIRYIGVVCGMLLTKQSITDSFWVNIHDRRTPFNGIIEYTNLNTDLRRRLGGRSIVYVPQYLRTTDPLYSYSDDTLQGMYLDLLKTVNPAFDPSWVERVVVSRAPHAQAICSVGFKDVVPGHATPVPNLFITDSVQYYPEDRTISAAIRLGRRVARLVRE